MSQQLCGHRVWRICGRGGLIPCGCSEEELRGRVGGKSSTQQPQSAFVGCSHKVYASHDELSWPMLKTLQHASDVS